MTRYWFTNCPTCGQGRLFVAIQEKTHAPMLECEECSRAWASPDQVSPTANAYLAIEIPSHFATADEIAKIGWFKWSFHQVAD